MNIRDLIKELEKELCRGDATIFIEYENITYNFDIGIDKNGQPLLTITSPTMYAKTGIETIMTKKLRETTFVSKSSNVLYSFEGLIYIYNAMMQEKPYFGSFTMNTIDEKVLITIACSNKELDYIESFQEKN